MIFNSLSFALFFTLIVLIYFICPHKYKWILLLLGSYCFYMFSNPKYILIIFISTIISYYIGIKMSNKQFKQDRKPFLMVGIIVNLGFLFLFKYLNFFIQSINQLFLMFNFKYFIPISDWGIPLGISFFTLQIISYLLDIYSGDIKSEKHFGYFALYVSFFLTIL